MMLSERIQNYNDYNEQTMKDIRSLDQYNYYGIIKDQFIVVGFKNGNRREYRINLREFKYKDTEKYNIKLLDSFHQDPYGKFKDAFGYTYSKREWTYNQWRFGIKNYLSSHENETSYTTFKPDMKIFHKIYKKDIDVQTIESPTIGFIDIETYTADGSFPAPEKDMKHCLTAITLSNNKTKKSHVFTYKDFKVNYDTKYRVVKHVAKDEADMIKQFLNILKKDKYDVFTGWNVIGYDIPFLYWRIDAVLNKNQKNFLDDYDENGNPPEDSSEEIFLDDDDDYSFDDFDDVPEETTTASDGKDWTQLLSYFGVVRLWEGKEGRDDKITILGTSVLDYMDLYKKFAYTNLQNYKLNTVAKVELDDSKLNYQDEGNIFTLYFNNFDMYIQYNIKDVDLLIDLDIKLNFIKLVQLQGYKGYINFDVAANSNSKVNEYALYKRLTKKKLLWPDPYDRHKEQYPGAFVQANPGFYDFAVSFDFESLYPGILRAFNLSPEMIVDEDYPREFRIDNPSGLCTAKDKGMGIVAEYVEDEFMLRRKYKKLKAEAKANAKEAKARGDKKAEAEALDKVDMYENFQMSQKIVINSMYGCLGDYRMYFYDIRIAKAITAVAREIIQIMRDVVDDEHLKTNKLDKLYSDVYILNTSKEKKIITGKDKLIIQRDNKYYETKVSNIIKTDKILIEK